MVITLRVSQIYVKTEMSMGANYQLLSLTVQLHVHAARVYSADSKVIIDWRERILITMNISLPW